MTNYDREWYHDVRLPQLAGADVHLADVLIVRGRPAKTAVLPLKWLEGVHELWNWYDMLYYNL